MSLEPELLAIGLRAGSMMAYWGAGGAVGAGAVLAWCGVVGAGAVLE